MMNYQQTLQSNRNVMQVVWANMPQGDVGDSLPMAGYSDRSVQVVGTFGGATVSIEGSNDGVTFATLTDPQGNPLTFVTSRLETIMEMTLYIRPKVTGGDGTTSLSTFMAVKAV
jgi:hypothetical protein